MLAWMKCEVIKKQDANSPQRVVPSNALLCQTVRNKLNESGGQIRISSCRSRTRSSDISYGNWTARSCPFLDLIGIPNFDLEADHRRVPGRVRGHGE